MKRNHIFLVLGWLLPVVAILLNGCRKNAVVSPPSMQAIIVYAGPDQYISTSVDGATLRGTAATRVGQIVKYEWTKIAGPEQYSLEDGDKSIARARNLVAGVYEFQLIATNNNGLSAGDRTKLTVSDPINDSPWDY